MRLLFCPCFLICIFHCRLQPLLILLGRYLGSESGVVGFSSHPAPSVLIPALRTVGNIVTGDDLQTQVSTIDTPF